MMHFKLRPLHFIGQPKASSPEEIGTKKSLWQGRLVHANLKTVSLAMAALTAAVGVAVGGVFLYQRHHQ